MDELIRGLSQSLAHAGPEWAVATVLMLIFAAKGVPIIEKMADARVRVEEERESRKAEESARRDESERERSRLEGRWLEQYEHAVQVQEQTNAVMAQQTAQMELLNATLNDSKDRSRSMAAQVDDIHRATVGKGGSR